MEQGRSYTLPLSTRKIRLLFRASIFSFTPNLLLGYHLSYSQTLFT